MSLSERILSWALIFILRLRFPPGKTLVTIMAGNRNKRSFTMAFKKEAIEFAELNSNRSVARKFNVDVKRIREWRQNNPFLKPMGKFGEKRNKNSQAVEDGQKMRRWKSVSWNGFLGADQMK